MSKSKYIHALYSRTTIIVLFVITAIMPPSDVTAVVRDSVLDVPSHLLIGLWREPDRHEFEHKSLLANTDFSFYWNPDFLWSRAQYQNNPTGFGFGLTKELTPSSGVHVGLNYALPRYDNEVYTPDKQSYFMRRLSFDLGFAWNITNFYYGFDKARRQYWTLMLGAKTARTTPSDQVLMAITNEHYSSYSTVVKEWSGGGYLGLQYRHILSPRVSLFAEPQLLVMSDPFDAGYNESGFDVGLSGKVGINYRLASMYYEVTGYEDEMTERRSNDDNLADNFFVQLHGGLATSLKGNTYGMTPLDKKGGIAFGINVGKWMNPLYGMRFGMFESVYKYAFDVEGEERYAQLHGFRGEVVLNPVRLITREKSIGRLGVDVSAGVEAGGIKKHRDPAYSRDHYFGLTAGGQLKFFVNRHAAMLLDGRYTMPAYTSDGGSYTDHVASAALGMEVYQTTFERYRKTSDRKPRSIGQDLRETWFIEFGAGLSHGVHAGEHFAYGIDPQLSFALGRHMNKYMSIRTRGELTPLRNDTLLKDKPAELLAGLSIDFMLTLTNLWMGVDPQRHMDMRLLVGQMILLEGLTNLDLGYELGVQISKRVTPHWELYFEPRYQVLYDFTSRWDLGAGATYSFAKYSRKQKLAFQRWYLQAMTGAELFPLNLNTKEVNTQFHKIGDVEFNVGRNMDPTWSLRAGIFAKELEVHSVFAPDAGGFVPQTSQYIGGRAEAVFSILHALSPRLERSRWNLSIGAGVEGGHLTNAYSTDEAGNFVEQHRINFGFTASGQLEYRLMEHTWLLGQLRMQQINLDQAYLPLSAHLGLQYDLHNRKRIDMRNARHRWYMLGGVGMMNGHIGTVDVAVGHNLSPRHGLRLGMTFADSPLRNMKWSLSHWLTGSADYTLNMSNLIFGVDDARRLDVSALVGLNLSLHGLREVTHEGSFKDYFHLDTYLGFEWGAHLQAHIVDGLSLYFEPRFAIQPWDDGLAVDHDRLQLFTTAGVRIDMNQYGKIRRWKERIGKDYLQAVYHIQPTLFYDRGIHGNDPGSGVELNYGHWFNDIVGIEGGLYYMGYKQFEQRSQAFGVRPTAVFDLASAMNPDWRGRPLGFVGMIGVNVGQIDMRYRYADLANHYEYVDPLTGHITDDLVHDSKVWRVAPTGSFQFRYALPRQHVALLLGTRFTYYSYPVHVDGKRLNYNYIPVSFQAGVQYNLR